MSQCLWIRFLLLPFIRFFLTVWTHGCIQRDRQTERAAFISKGSESVAFSMLCCSQIPRLLLCVFCVCVCQNRWRRIEPFIHWWVENRMGCTTSTHIHTHNTHTNSAGSDRVLGCFALTIFKTRQQRNDCTRPKGVQRASMWISNLR